MRQSKKSSKQASAKKHDNKDAKPAHGGEVTDYKRSSSVKSPAKMGDVKGSSANNFGIKGGQLEAGKN